MSINRVLVAGIFSASALSAILGVGLLVFSVYFYNFNLDGEEWYFKVCPTNSEDNCQVVPLWLSGVAGLLALGLSFYLSKIGITWCI